MPEPTRLERLLFRLDAQHKSLAWAFGEIETMPGPVFELGLGHGRTFDHMRRHLPERDIYVFDREIDCFPDCRPDETHLIMGQLADTLPKARHRFAGQAVLVHSDVGTYDAEYNIAVAKLVSTHLSPLLAPRRDHLVGSAADARRQRARAATRSRDRRPLLHLSRYGFMK